jgi:predicted DNA-binding protein (MmcQ/YjbR family)
MPKENRAAVAKKLRSHALSYPETTEAFPWGESAFKVKGKTFVFMRAEPNELSFSVKLLKSRKKGLALPGSEPTHYGLGAKGWVTLRPTEKTSLELLLTFVDESYRAIAPKRVLAQLESTPSSTLSVRRFLLSEPAKVLPIPRRRNRLTRRIGSRLI